MTHRLSSLLNWFFLPLSALCLSACSHGLFKGRAVEHSQDLFLPMTFIEHNGPGPVFLAMNIHQPSVDELRLRVEDREGSPLISPPESALAVITPAEYERHFKTHLPISRINEIAREQNIQQKVFQPVCVGRGPSGADEKSPRIYFIVLKAPQLVELRQTLREALVSAGGQAEGFHSEEYQPQITVGYTQADLLTQDISKDEKSCVLALKAAGSD